MGQQLRSNPQLFVACASLAHKSTDTQEYKLRSNTDQTVLSFEIRHFSSVMPKPNGHFELVAVVTGNNDISASNLAKASSTGRLRGIKLPSMCPAYLLGFYC